MRSLASETARRVDARRAASGDAPDPEGTETREEHVGVDWFTLDFNEELSAFHGAVASRQTEFAAFAIERVLARYPHGTPVIIAGHSMGGVVARAALLELNRATTRRTAVDATVVTIATPHEKSPAATQPAVARFYERTNRAWADERNADVTSRVAIVSVGGGDADRQVRPARAKPPTAWTKWDDWIQKKKIQRHARRRGLDTRLHRGERGPQVRGLVPANRRPHRGNAAGRRVRPTTRRRGRSRRSRANSTRTDGRRKPKKPNTRKKTKTKGHRPARRRRPRSRSIGPLPSSRSCSRWRSTRSSCRRRRGGAGSAWRVRR